MASGDPADGDEASDLGWSAMKKLPFMLSFSGMGALALTPNPYSKQGTAPCVSRMEAIHPRPGKTYDPDSLTN